MPQNIGSTRPTPEVGPTQKLDSTFSKGKIKPQKSHTHTGPGLSHWFWKVIGKPFSDWIKRITNCFAKCFPSLFKPKRVNDVSEGYFKGPEADLKLAAEKKPIDLGLSELDVPFRTEKWHDSLTPKMMAHIHTDKFIGGTHLEGESPFNTLSLNIQFYKSLKNNPDLSEKEKNNIDALILLYESALKSLLLVSPNLQAIQAKAIEMAQRVNDLKAGEIAVMVGGIGPYFGASGHAELLLFKKREDGKAYDFYVFNTGGGAEHHGTWKEEYEKRLRAVKKYENVSHADLFLTTNLEEMHPHWFIELYHLLYPQESKFGKEVPTVKLLYEKFEHFKEKETIPENALGTQMKAQTSGTCAWRSTLALARFILPYKTYKKIHYDFTYQSLIAFYQKEKNNLPSDPEKLYLFKICVDKAKLSAAKRYPLENMSPEEWHLSQKRADVVAATLEQLSLRLQEIEDHSAQQKKTVTPFGPNDVPPLKPIPGQYKSFLDGLHKNNVILPTTGKPGNISSQPFDPITFVTPENFLNAISRINSVPESDKLLFVNQLEQVVEIIPLPDTDPTFWKNIPNETIDEIIKQLHLGLKHYSSILMMEGKAFPKQQNVLLALVVYIHALAVRKDSDLALYGINLGSAINNLDPHLVYYDKATYDRWKQLLKYFVNLPQQQKLFNFVESIPRSKLAHNTDFLFMKNMLYKHNLQIDCDNINFKDQPKEIKEAGQLFEIGDNSYLAEQKETQHFHVLRQSVLIFQKQNAGVQSLARLYEHQIDAIFSSIRYDNEILKITFSYGEYLSNMYSLMHRSQGIGNPFPPSGDVFSRTSNNRPTEGKAITLFLGEKRDQLLGKKGDQHYRIPRPLGETHIEPKLQPAKVISYYGNHLDELTTSEGQTAFDISFFKEADGNIALYNELSKNQSFRTACIGFINRGINYFYENQPNKTPLIYPCLFFARLASRLQQNCHQLGIKAQIPDMLPFLNLWLKSHNITDLDRQMIHLHRLFYYNTLDPNFLNSKAFQEIVESWMVCNKFSNDPKWAEPHLWEEMKRFFYRISPTIREKLNGEELTKTCNNILIQFSLESSEKLAGVKWNSNNFPVCTSDTGWSINLLTTQINSPSGEMSAAHLDISATPEYRRLFGDQEFIVTENNKTYFFTHPVFGRIRAFEKKAFTPTISEEESKYEQESKYHYETKKIKQVNSLIIQREFNGAWYQYVNPLKCVSIPKVLIADHTHWMAIEGDQELLVFDQKHGDRLVARMQANELQISEKNSAHETTKNSKIYEMLKCFELPDWTMMEANSITNRVEKIVLARYQRPGGQTLTFNANKEGQFCWEANPDYALMDQPKGLLKNIPNYLVLTSLSNPKKRKILVPIQMALQSLAFSPERTLDVIDEHRMQEYAEKNPLLVTQNNAYSYIDYDLAPVDAIHKGREVSVSDADRGLYLAYLYFIQKDYKHAAEILRDIPKNSPLSEQGRKFYTYISSHKDNSPAAYAVKALASLKGGQLDTLSIEDYMKGHKYIEEAVRLTPEELRSFWIAPFHREDLSIGLANPLPLKHLLAHPSSYYHGRRSYRFEFFKYWSSWSISLNPNIKPPISSSPIQLESYFGYFYEQAKLQKTEEEKNAFACYLGYATKVNDLNEGLLYILRGVLLAPDKKNVPKLPISDIELEKWIETCKKYLPIDENPSIPEQKYSTATKSRQLIPMDLSPANIDEKGSSPKLRLRHKNAQERSPLNLKGLADQYFIAKHSDLKFPKANWKSANLNEQDTNYEKAINTCLKSFQKDYDIGLKKNHEEYTYTQLPNTDLKKLQGELKTKIATQTEKVRMEKAEILKLANKSPQSPMAAFRHALLKAGKYRKEVELEQLITLFLHGDSELYRNMNPNLTAMEIEYLDRAIQSYLIEKTELDQAQYAFTELEKLVGPVDIQTPIIEDPVQLEKVARILSAAPQGTKNQKLERVILTLEHRSVESNVDYQGYTRVRKEQADLLEKLLEIEDSKTGACKSAVGQLMMGGGKTSVLAAILLELQSHPGRIPIFVVPQAQFESAKINLLRNQHKYFGQEVISFDFQREQFTEGNLALIASALSRSQTQRPPSIILFKADLWQGLRSEWVSLNLQKTRSPEVENKVEILTSIVGMAEQFGDLLCDEVDLLLHPLVEVNYPVGQKQPLPEKDIKLMHDIFVMHLQTPARLDDKQRSNDFNKQAYLNAQPQIAGSLFEQYHNAWGFTADQKALFVRYVMGQIFSNTSNKQEKAFLNLLRTFERQLDGQWVKQQVDLCQFVFKTILNDTVEKMSNFQFGRLPGHLKAKVVKYNGVGSPADTDFGQPHEAAAYHFQEALYNGVLSEQVILFAKHKQLAVQIEAETKGILPGETSAEKEFLDITGVPLHQIQEKGRIKEALTNVNKNPLSILAIEAATIAECVGYYDEQVTSNSFDFVHQFNTFRGMSGILWNSPCFPSKLQNNMHLDVGVEGRIASMMLAREQLHKKVIHETPNSSVKDVLDSVMTGTNRKDQARALMDVSAMFADQGDNQTVAKEIISYFKDHPKIKQVLFFGKRNPTDRTSDVLCLMDKTGKVTVIGSTNAAVLSAMGIRPEETFTYYDQRHCEATDIIQSYDAMGIVTINQHVIERTFFQGEIRLRGYFDRQDTEYVVQKDARALLLNKGKSVYDFIQTSVKNQAIQISKLTPRSFKNWIDHEFRSFVEKKMLEKKTIVKRSYMDEGDWKKEIVPKNPVEQFSIANKYRNILVTRQNIHPDAQFGSLAELINTPKELENYGNKKLEIFKACNPSPEEFLQMKKRLHEIIKMAKDSHYLPKKVEKGTNEANLGTQQDVAISVQQSQDLQLDLQKEIQLELRKKQLTLYEEDPWARFDLSNIGSFDKIYSTNVIFPIEELFQIDAIKSNYDRNYSAIFKDKETVPIYVSMNFAHTMTEKLSVFDPLQKSADQVLVETSQNGTLKSVTILSAKDAATWKALLDSNSTQPRFCLMLRDGQILSTNKFNLDPREEAHLQKLLLKINFFNGNVDYLCQPKNRKLAQEFIGNDEVKRRYLAYKTSHNPSQKDLLTKLLFLK